MPGAMKRIFDASDICICLSARVSGCKVHGAQQHGASTKLPSDTTEKPRDSQLLTLCKTGNGVTCTLKIASAGSRGDMKGSRCLPQIFRSSYSHPQTGCGYVSLRVGPWNKIFTYNHLKTDCDPFRLSPSLYFTSAD